ncbi:Lactase-phlorizin hydrolase [Orchesella cincta]|uniref:beta-glucosidase n=1 Tax=Orchesella cincta TaxID=48709 RepID=A0A1D2MNB7_ORCCI|nr:Lactase-phlorizin hydrolase [Orchesella cincta]
MSPKFSMVGLVLVALSLTSAQNDSDFLYDYFPEDFEWGFATASYQIEGAWNVDGKGQNIWDEFTHRNVSPIVDGSSGDVACDSYNKYLEDVELLKNTGVNFYRFSLSWSRLLPDGTNRTVNQRGIDYYNKLINALIANGIEPMVTLYHWDLPLALQGVGGWTNETVVQHFENYARLAYSYFGDRVKQWITLNEPFVVCQLGHGDGVHAPGHTSPVEPYLCAHNILKSHASAYRLYERDFKESQGGQVGVTLDSGWYEPEDPNNPDHVEAAERAVLFKHGWYAFPIFFGDYPPVMRQLIDQKSEAEGLQESRLPEFDNYWSQQLNGSYDFLGLNHYTTELVVPENRTDPGYSGDQNTRTYQSAEWPESASSWLKVVPWGFRKIMNWIKNTYGNPTLYVTENGFSDTDAEGVNDQGRVDYYRDYTNNMLKAIKLDGCNIKKYTAWSLIDNFEWARGYTERFGAHFVDFNDPARMRTPKRSQGYLKQLFADNGFPPPKQ